MYVMYLVRGLVALVLGVALLVAGGGMSLLASFIGGYWIVGAVLTLRWVASSKGARGRSVGAIVGVVGLLAGILLFLRQLIDALIDQGLLLDFIGLSAIAMGLLRLAGTFRDDQLAGERPRARYRLVVGAMEIALGIAVLLVSEGTQDEIRYVLGVWGVLTGTFLVLDALRLRRLTRADDPAAASASPS
jgi:uncharacterized membrane protein HdeD (DUF308 family)